MTELQWIETRQKWRREIERLEAALRATEDPADKAAFAALQPSSAAAAEASATGAVRTPKDYAIEHAEYMAKTGEQLLEAMSQHAEALMALEEADEPGDYLTVRAQQAEEILGEYMAYLRRDIYEFRKRRDRAATPTTAPTGKVEAVKAWHLMSWEERYNDREAECHDLSERIIKLKRALAHPPGEPVDASRVCQWTYEDDPTYAWSTKCGHLFQITDGTPEENNFKFCCYCGGKIGTNHG